MGACGRDAGKKCAELNSSHANNAQQNEYLSNGHIAGVIPFANPNRHEMAIFMVNKVTLSLQIRKRKSASSQFVYTTELTHVLHEKLNKNTF